MRIERLSTEFPLILDLIALGLFGLLMWAAIVGPLAKSPMRKFIFGVALLGDLLVTVHLALTFRSAQDSETEVSKYFPLIQKTEGAYHEPFGEYLPLPPCPVGVPSAQPRELDRTCLKEWADLGIRPEGPLYCTWEVVTEPTVKITATCDLDGDGKFARYEGDLTAFRALDEGVK